MNASPTTDTNHTTAPLALWRAAEAFMHILAALFGDPSHIAAKHTLTLKAHQLMASWLRTGEAMMRRLLLIEAAAYSKPNGRLLLRAPRKRTRHLKHFFAEASEKWRVSFRCFYGPPAPRRPAPAHAGRTLAVHKHPRPFIIHEDPRPHRLRQSRAQRRGAGRKRYPPILRQDREIIIRRAPIHFRSAWALAERYEALLRAYNDPLPYARRLSRQLHATPHRVRELFIAPPEARERIESYDQLALAAETSAAVFNTS